MIAGAIRETEPGQHRAGHALVKAVASRIYSDFYLPFEAYLFAAGIYLTITFSLVGVLKLTERHFLGHLSAIPPNRERLKPTCSASNTLFRVPAWAARRP